VGFQLHSISTLPPPYRILITPDRPLKQRVMVLQYHTSAGLVDEYEEAPQLNRSEFRAMVKHWVGLNGKPGTEGSSAAAQLKGGYPATITTTASGSTSDIRWIQTGIEYMIRGPSLTKTDCIRFANALILSVQSNS
jgi:hypothetical protein